MGNSSTKEARSDPRTRPGEGGPATALAADRQERTRNRASRSDLGGLLGITTHVSANSQPPYERRETRQEREARRLERERQARLVERERSMREEHVDGGYLVTLGTYVGSEDFSKPIVRQLQIERKLAPFWRGLQDFSDNWAEHQIIAAARGLPIPPADETPPEDLVPRPLSSESPPTSAQNLNNLTVPLGARTLSAASDRSASNAGSSIPSPAATGPTRGGSPFKPRAKAALAAALSGTSRNGSTTDITPREVTLPPDPFVNGQPLEVFLYKDASECPICFLSYPPYLNHTRCCDQAICSECFVQIKRADPHYPEGHGDNPDNPNPNVNPEEQAGQLISEPACCPYCQQPEFGVTYDPPPLRRGLTYSINQSTMSVGAMGTAMSSSSSLNSPGSLTPPSAVPAGLISGSRRRTQSLSANAPNVITTDRVRPDWSTKLATQRAHIARRAAAATALHTAAFLMGSAESRPFRVGRFSRRNTGSGNTPEGEGSSTNANPAASGEASPTSMEPGARGSSGRAMLGGDRRSRMEDLEELMFREALRQSLATEEERRRKSEKEEKKEAKKREKEERKAAKTSQKHGSTSGPYTGSGPSSASGSSLSLSKGRGRGNSGTSNLRMEASVASAIALSGADGVSASPAISSNEKGKGVDRGPPCAEVEAVEGESSQQPTSSPRPIPSPHQPAGPSHGPSHLRQMSSASSVSSSLPDSAPGSYQNPAHLQDPRASGLSLGSRSGASEDGGDQGEERDPTVAAEPMFNFSSLAEMVGVQLEGEHAGRRLSIIGREALTGQGGAGDESEGSKAKEQEHLAETQPVEVHRELATSERVEDVALPGEQQTTLDVSTSTPEFDGGTSSSKSAAATILAPPTVMVTPETPAPRDDEEEESKQLGYETTTVERANEITQ